jgi:Ca-activated chloride channel family protein
MKLADINARLSRTPIERYEWPLAAAILVFSIALLINDRKRRPAAVRAESKRPIAAATAAALFLAIGSWAQAASPGLELYRQQKFHEAYEDFEQTLKENPGTRQRDRIDFDAGAAAYKMQDYNKALQSFSQALLSKDTHLQSASHYNLGNTLYEHGEAQKSDAKKLTDWENALQHYEQTLKMEPRNKEAKDNYDYVKKKIDELKQKKEQQQKQQNQKQQQQQQGQNEQSPPPSPTPPIEPDEAAKKAKAEADKAVLAHEFERALRIMTDQLRVDQTVQYYADYMKRLEDINGIKDARNP